MVFLQHGITGSINLLDIDGTAIKRLYLTIANGKVGVSIFFVLSGFLITYLLISEYKIHRKINLKRFYIRRFLRIWPLFYGIVLFSFLLYPGIKSMLGVHEENPSNVFYYLSFLSNFDSLHIHQGITESGIPLHQGITWSVSIEEQFYLFWPLIFLFGKKWWGAIIGLVICISIAFRVYHHMEGHVLYFHTLAVMIDLAIGGFTAWLIHQNKSVRSSFEKAGTKTHLLLFALVFVFLYFGTDFLFGAYSRALGRIILAILFALIIATQALTKQSSWLNLSHFTFAKKWGKYTYGIYLLHPIAIVCLHTLTLALKLEYQQSFTRFFLFGVLSFLLTLLLSYMSYHFFEHRFLKLKEKYQVIKSSSEA